MAAGTEPGGRNASIKGRRRIMNDHFRSQKGALKSSRPTPSWAGGSCEQGLAMAGSCRAPGANLGPGRCLGIPGDPQRAPAKRQHGVCRATGVQSWLVAAPLCPKDTGTWLGKATAALAGCWRQPRAAGSRCQHICDTSLGRGAPAAAPLSPPSRPLSRVRQLQCPNPSTECTKKEVFWSLHPAEPRGL